MSESYLTQTETSTQGCPQSSSPSISSVAAVRGYASLTTLRYNPNCASPSTRSPQSKQIEATEIESPEFSFSFQPAPKLPIQSTVIACIMAEQPAKRARRTDSAAMWDKNEGTSAPKKSQRPTEDSREISRKDSDRDSVNEIKERKRNDERRHEGRRPSRSRDRHQTRRERSRSRDRPFKGKDRDRDRDRVREDRRGADRDRDRDARGSRRERERSRSPDRHRSSKGSLEPSAAYSNTSD